MTRSKSGQKELGVRLRIFTLVAALHSHGHKISFVLRRAAIV